MSRTVNFSQGEKLEQQIPLSSITTSQNPRLSHRGLLELFQEKGAADNTPECRAEYVAHIDANFPHIRQRAESIKTLGQLQAVTLRSFRSKVDDEYVEKYGVCQGECRILAWGLIEAETGVPQKVRAVVEKLTLDEAFERALAENIEREDMSPIDMAASFNEMLTTRINPATVKPVVGNVPNPFYDENFPKGRPYTLKEVAEKVKRDYHWVRSRAALAYLPAPDKAQVEADHQAGKRDLTRFCKKAARLATALKTQAKETGVPVENLLDQLAGENPAVGVDGQAETSIVTVRPEVRRHVLGLKKVEALFDATTLDNRERLAAFAEVMGIADTASEALRIALKEREARALEAELKSGRVADRQSRRQQSA